MSTRSTINIKNEDGSVDGIYCHFDGFPDNTGSLLLNNYDSDEKVRELIDLGDISFLGPTLAQDHTKSYHRAEGDPIEISRSPDEADLMGRQEYNYLWKEGMWWMAEENTNK